MREILFRGIEYGSKDFVYGDVIRDGDEFSIREHFRPVCHIVIPETIGQFTGLKDKNSLPIFEGDIVKWTLNSGFVVPGFTYETDYLSRVSNYNPGEISEDTTFTSFVFFCKQNGAWMLQTDKDSKAFLTGEINRNLLGEVIGNIHDNPELLEEE